MNWDRVEGNWKQVTGKVKEQWGKLTDDDLTVINGKQDQLVGRIQERYGVAKDEAAPPGPGLWRGARDCPVEEIPHCTSTAACAR
ncbi:MAG TPA: CsbD family protein [Gemmataceae bacterium]